MDLPPFHLRVIEDIHAARARFGLLLAGAYALRAHGLAARPAPNAGPGMSERTELDEGVAPDFGGDLRVETPPRIAPGPRASLDFVATGETPLAEVTAGVAAELERHGLAAEAVELGRRMGRLAVTDEIGGQTCEVRLLSETLRGRPTTLDRCPVVGLDDAVGLQVRALHDRGLPEDFADLVSVSELHPFREMERLGALHTDDWRLDDLLRRLESVDLLADEAFAACGLDDDGVDAVRRFAYAWAEDIRLRRVEDGDIDEETFDQDILDIPDVD
ncbi:hypothetical protein [Microtetraspora fusca]|uniref:hypothetical protein n=1 Tax=Microtetraspora fusca TaxID=1997 RepID=UPI0008343B31|nr:hypothetical protein [Microtetraspora fusca]